MDSYFAVTAPGLEPFAASELSALLGGVSHSAALEEPLQAEPGGVSFKGGLAGLYLANLHLRTASRILARLGTFFYATTFPELEQRASRLPWERFITPAQPISLRLTCHKSKLYHTGAVARSIVAALALRLGQSSPVIKTDEQSDQPPQLVIVRLFEDKCTVSVDSSGTILHKRGYRQAVAKAPLRETLAAGIILASGWDTSSPFIDPFCGSGTLPIEAALLARGIPPGLNRHFAFMDWPNFDSALWESLRHSITMSHTTPLILASDRDAGAVKMAQANAERAGVAEFIDFKCQSISALVPPAGPGWVVTNPPYGERISAGKDLRDLYAQFGNVLRRQCPGWNLSILCSDPILLGQLHFDLDTTLRLSNGGIPVRLARGQVPFSD